MFRATAPAPRDYQKTIAERAKGGNTLVVLPTGMGKTLVAALVMEPILSSGRKAIVLAPTKPLSEQHRKTMLSLFEIQEGKVELVTGGTTAKKRKELWSSALIALATPQTLENDLKSRRASLDGVGLVVFDEAHRCVGKYAYTYIAEKCKDSGVLVLGLTASPGGDERKIRAIAETLGIERVEIRSEEDEDVREYVQPVSVKWVGVELPESIEGLRHELNLLINERAGMFVKLGLIGGTSRLSKRRLIELRHKIMASGGGWKYSALSRYAEIFNLVHAHELLETQGLGTFLDFFQRMEGREDKSKAVQRLLVDEGILGMLERARSLDLEHPKMSKLSELIRKRRGKSFIVFVQYRDQIRRIVEALLVEPGIKPVRFIGKRDGVSAQEQKDTIAKFRAGEYNVLVATQIGEEGLDIPTVDCVIFYEPVPSEIRSIQRRGRAGRTKAGEVIVLVTRGTRDEAYYWVSKKKEKRMRRVIGKMQKEKETVYGTGESGGASASRGDRIHLGEEETGKGEVIKGKGEKRGRGQTKISDYA